MPRSCRRRSTPSTGSRTKDRRTASRCTRCSSGAASAWLRGERRGFGCGRRSAPRVWRPRIEAALREAAGLDTVLEEERAELLRFVERMTAAAEARDLLEGEEAAGPGISFPPLKRRIRGIAPDRAAEMWLARLRALGGDAGGAGNGKTPDAGAGEKPDAAGA